MLLSYIRMFLCVPVSHRQWQRNLEVSFQEQRYARRLTLYIVISILQRKLWRGSLTPSIGCVGRQRSRLMEGQVSIFCDSYTLQKKKTQEMCIFNNELTVI